MNLSLPGFSGFLFWAILFSFLWVLLNFLRQSWWEASTCFLLIGWRVPQASWSTATFTSKIEGNSRRVLVKQAFLSPGNFSSLCLMVLFCFSFSPISFKMEICSFFCTKRNFVADPTDWSEQPSLGCGICSPRTQGSLWNLPHDSPGLPDVTDYIVSGLALPCCILYWYLSLHYEMLKIFFSTHNYPCHSPTYSFS